MKVSFLVCLCFLTSVFGSDKPHIIVILADDLGFNDIGYRNPEVISPNMDQLAADGVILDRNYVQPVCTPTRTSLLTGMYPYHLGRQGLLPIRPNQPSGLTTDVKLLPEYLKEVGYDTHIVGKWHLGHCNKKFLPHNRGFDTAYGFWSGGEDHYSKQVNGLYDFQFNGIVTDTVDIYSSDCFSSRASEVIQNHNQSNPLFLYAALHNVHTPLQVPKKYEDLYPDIEDSDRKTYMGMVTAIDDFVGKLIEDLKDKKMYENSVIIFSSDNGGMLGRGGASNYPLNGAKATLYEGGIRVPGFIHSPKFVQNPGRIYDKLLHVSDWFPTILNLAGVTENFQNLDGVDQFQSLFEDKIDSPGRKMVVNEVDDGYFWGNRGAFQIEGGWKFVKNPVIFSLRSETYLYNVNDDPSETTDLKSVYPDILQSMEAQFEELLKTMVPADRPNGNPFQDISDGNGNVGSSWC